MKRTFVHFIALCSIVLGGWLDAQEPQPITVILQDGVDNYSGTRDSYLYSYHPITNYGSDSRLRDKLTYFQTLIDFAIFESEGGPIPNDVIIESATLSLYKSTNYYSIYHLHRILNEWNEKEVTWNHRLANQLWDTAGAQGIDTDISAVADAEASVAFNPGWLEFDITSAIQDRSDGASYFGWFIKAASNNINIKNFVSRESIADISLRPKLIISYKPPYNKWLLKVTDAPVRPWEKGIAYDPTTGLVVFHGGHINEGSESQRYPQSGYTFLYDVATNRFRESQAPSRPQRRCIVELCYLDSISQVVTVHGGTDHGSWQVGDVARDGTKVDLTDPVGPWWYNSVEDSWIDARTLLPKWERAAHAQLAYDSSTDLMYSITSAGLALYSPRFNQSSIKELPAALANRIGYGIAADPVHRKLVVFGGTGPVAWKWAGGMEKSEAYDLYVHNDTWLYDRETNTWEEVTTPVRPPKGMPLYNHIRLPMVYHAPSGTILLVQNSINTLMLDHTTWPAVELWSFDVGSRTWTKIPTENNPQFPGIMAYASNEDQLVMLGGADDQGDPYQSRYLYTMRVQIPGRDIVTPPAHEGQVAVEITDTGFIVTWPTEAGVGYWIERGLTSSTGVKTYERLNSTPLFTGIYVDNTITFKKSYAYRVRVNAPQARWSTPVFTGPMMPTALRVSVASSNQVVLNWDPPVSEGPLTYKVYRYLGSKSYTQQLLTSTPVAATTFIDSTVDLSGGLIYGYTVSAIDKHGTPSGASPMRYTVPEPPLQLHAVVVDGQPAIDITWQLPSDVDLAGYNLYHVDYHLNTHEASAATVQAWLKSWHKVNAVPITGNSFRFSIPPSSQDKPHQYFRLVGVNPLGQEGLNSDIVSATDNRFRPAVPVPSN